MAATDDADGKDHEQTCLKQGIVDFRGMRRRLPQVRKAREEKLEPAPCLPPHPTPAPRTHRPCRGAWGEGLTPGAGVGEGRP